MTRVKLNRQKSIDSKYGKKINNFIAFLKFFRVNRKLPFPKKIVVFKLDSIGDGILSLPMIKVLKEKTKAKIIVACSKANYDVFYGQEFIDEIVVFDTKGSYWKSMLRNLRRLRKENFDLAIDTGQSSNISGIFSYFSAKRNIGFKKSKGNRNKVYDFLVPLSYEKHMVENYINLLKPININLTSKPELVRVHYEKKDLDSVLKKLNNKKNLIAVHPCHAIEYKSWEGYKFAKVIEFLSEKNNLVIVGIRDEIPKIKEVLDKVDKKYHNKILDLSGKLNLKELFALMDKIDLFVSNDGGPMHIAAAMGVPTLGLINHELPYRYAPWAKNSIELYKNFEYNPFNGEKIPKEFENSPESNSIENVKRAINKIRKYIK